MSIAWIVDQIISTAELCAGNPPKTDLRFNPKPWGKSQPGGATEAVRAFLVARPGKYFSHAQIRAACPSYSRNAVDWALIRLREWGEIKTVTDFDRNDRYFLYSYPVAGQAADLKPASPWLASK